MNTYMLMSKFIENYVVREKKERWLGMAKKEGALYKKSNQIERCLNRFCLHKNWNGENILAQFIHKNGPVWAWSFSIDDPIRFASVGEISDEINQRRIFLAVSEQSGKSLYFNGDCDYWICSKEQDIGFDPCQRSAMLINTKNIWKGK